MFDAHLIHDVRGACTSRFVWDYWHVPDSTRCSVPRRRITSPSSNTIVGEGLGYCGEDRSRLGRGLRIPVSRRLRKTYNIAYVIFVVLYVERNIWSIAFVRRSLPRVPVDVRARGARCAGITPVAGCYVDGCRQGYRCAHGPWAFVLSLANGILPKKKGGKIRKCGGRKRRRKRRKFTV